jgi:endoglucanase
VRQRVHARSGSLLLLLVAMAANSAAMATVVPQISAFTPASGAAGTTITVTGSDLTAINAAWIGAGHDATVTHVSSSIVKVTVPKDASSGRVALTDGSHWALTDGDFVVTSAGAAAAPPASTGNTNEHPVISSFTPTSGPAGTVVTISGTQLSAIKAAWVGSGHDAAITNINDSSLKITVPKDASSGLIALGNGKNWGFTGASFTVKATASSTTPPAGGSNTNTYPVITAFSPSSGAPGTVVSITGSQLSAIKAAWVGNGHDAGVTNVSATNVKITVPSDASSGLIALSNGSNWSFTGVPFSVTTSGGSGSGSSPPATGGTGTGSTGPGTSTGPETPPTSPGTGMSIRVKGNELVDGTGNVVQLRGANTSALEFVAIQGWDPASPWGGAEPNWAALRSWKLNSVRIPLNEASWLGLTTYDHDGTVRKADPGGNYQATVVKAVNDAVAAGLYVILDLHWAAPNVTVAGQASAVPGSPLTQNPMADVDHSLAFWKSIATTFKSNPAVLFELFNEPFFYWLTTGEDQWSVLRDGGTITEFITGAANPYDIAYNWKSAGMQSMLSAVRATGATNVVLAAGLGWSQDISQWVLYKPTDPLNQLAAVWHAYPPSGTTRGTAAYSTLNWVWADAILAAGIPVVITETGDHDTAGTVGAPLVSNVLAWADKSGASVLGWGWNVWQDPDFVLIKDASGTPTDGYGKVFHDWAVNHK